MPTLTQAIGPRSALARVLRPLVNPLLPTQTTPVRVLTGPGRGLRLMIEPRREKYYWTGGHEVDVQRALVRLLSPGATFWDVGAHVGFLSMLAARTVGPDGAVHAFEPLAENAARLRAGARLNGFANVAVHEVAVSDATGETTLHRHGSTLMWTLVPALGEEDGRVVACATLDDLADRLGDPDVVKIDVEGAELDVLHGGARLLERRCPALVVELATDDRHDVLSPFLSRYRLEAISGRHAVLT